MIEEVEKYNLRLSFYENRKNDGPHHLRIDDKCRVKSRTLKDADKRSTECTQNSVKTDDR